MRKLLLLLLWTCPLVAFAHTSTPQPIIEASSIDVAATNSIPLIDGEITVVEEKVVNIKVKKPSFFQRIRQRHRIKSINWGPVDPLLRAKLTEIYNTMSLEGYDIRLVEGYRSPERQAQLQLSGGGVTQVGPGRSCHQYGLAVDSAVFVKGQASWNMKNPAVRNAYMRYGELANLAGLQWGGHWTSLKDYPHVELRSACQLAIRNKKSMDPSMMYAGMTRSEKRRMDKDKLIASLPTDGPAVCMLEEEVVPFPWDTVVDASSLPDPFADFMVTSTVLVEQSEACNAYQAFDLDSDATVGVWLNMQQQSNVSLAQCQSWTWTSVVVYS